MTPSPHTCAQCEFELAAGARFCRECGAPVPEPAVVARVCPACDATSSPTARFCRACGEPLGGDEPTTPVLAPPAATPPPPAPAGGLTAAPAPRTTWRPPKYAAIAAVALLLAGGATGAFLLLRADERDVAPVAVEPPAPPAAIDEPAQTLPTPETDEQTQTGETDETPPADDSSPTGVLRAHWQAIADHDYDAAFDLLSADYRGRVSRARWVGDHEGYAPRVYVRLVDFLQPLPGAQAYVFADVFTRDTGSLGDSSVCNRFAGKVRVVKRGQLWRYVPGAAGDTFGKKAVLRRSDPNCGRLFG
jgi:ribosomal protein L40E